ncbi:MAG: glycosyltransferase family 1 protein [Magnetococcales bacterium]|nr:glycosyltransferase family 1 protein [Magnetococcales bacterium]
MEKRLKETLRKNLQVLRVFHPALHGRLSSYAGDSSYRLSFSEGGGEKRLLVRFSNGVVHKLPDQERVRAFCDELTRSSTSRTVPLLMGLGSGMELLHLYRRTHHPDTSIRSRKVPLYVVERDLSLFHLALMLHDLRDLLFEPRVAFFVGDGCYAACLEHLSRTDVQRPDRVYTPHTDPLEEGRAFLVLLQDTFQQVQSRHQGRLQALHHHYRQRSDEAWRDLYDGSARRPLRVMGLTCRFSTYVQFCMRDLLSGFRKLGCATALIREEEDFHQLNAYGFVQALHDFKPDLFILIDHLRWEYRGLLPEALPVVSWIQDLLDNVVDETEGPLTQRDVIFSFSKAWIDNGIFSIPMYRNHTIGLLGVGINTDVYHPLPGVEKDIDVLVVSHLLEPEITLWPLRVGAALEVLNGSEEALIKQGVLSLEQLVRLYREIIRRMAQWDLDQMLRMLLARKYKQDQLRVIFDEAGLGEISEALLTLFPCDVKGRMEWELLTALKMYPVRHLMNSGIDVHVYGRNWDQYPGLERVAKGTANNGAALNMLTNRARICLQNSPGTSLHMRALEVMGAGAFMIGKRVPRLLDNHPISDYFSEEDGELVLFDTPDELLHLVQHYLGDAAARRRVAKVAYEKVVTLFSYRHIANRMLEAVRDATGLGGSGEAGGLK